MSSYILKEKNCRLLLIVKSFCNWQIIYSIPVPTYAIRRLFFRNLKISRDINFQKKIKFLIFNFCIKWVELLFGGYSLISRKVKAN